MANQKALITAKTDFIQAGVEGVVVKPLIFSNGEDLPADAVYTGTPSFVDGIRGKAVNHGGTFAYRFRNMVHANTTKKMLSFWIKATPADVGASSGWKILATHRGVGQSDYGFHVAIYNGQLNLRVFGSNGSVNLYTDGLGGQPNWRVKADTWYHIVVRYDTSLAFPEQVYVNNVRMLYSSTKITLGSFTRTFTVGDMLSSAAGLQYPFGGIIDEFIFLDDDAWDDATRTAYYDAMLAGKFLDYWTEPGSLMLNTTPGGSYASGTYTWESSAIDLGAPFSSYGRVQVNYDAPGGTTLKVSTSTSDDGASWGTYKQIGEDGVIKSLNKRYIKIKVEMATSIPNATPRLDELQILEYGATEILSLINAPLKIFKDLASGLQYAGELTNAYDIIIDEEINGENTLTFKLPINDPKRKEMGDEPVEMVAEIANRRYIIREATDERGDGGKVYTQFKAEAFFYELRDFKVINVELQQTTAYNAITQVLKNSLPACGWTLARCDIASTKLRDIKFEWKSVLGCLRDIVDTWGGELIFDDVNKEISLITAQGQDNGVRFYYSKNLKKVVRNVNTYELVTRLYPYGKGGLTIKSVNNNVEYIEDMTWVNALNLRNKIRVGQWKDEAYIYPQNLLDDAKVILADSSKPQISYVIEVQDLSLLSGHEHESFYLGDTVYTVDKDLLSTEVKSRIVRRSYNVRQPWKTVVELSQPKKMLSDAMRSSIDDKVEYLAQAELLNTTDARQMTVFNYLLNSRGDEGFASWAQEGTGFALEAGGYSGGWSFKVEGGFGKSNKLSQRVYGVSHRSSYTISAAVATEGTIVKGGTLAEPFAGMKVVIHYTDGTSETKYLAIEDATSGTDTTEPTV